MTRVLIGTSGYGYAHWRGVLYPPGVPQHAWLETYAETFGAVELNVTFYRLPSKDVFRSWRDRTPEAFRFAVKGNRTVTHYRRLRDVGGPVRELAGRAKELGDKLAVVLWQLPPGMVADVGLLEDFAGLLDSEMPDCRHAFEFRDPSWSAPAVYSALRAHGHALCVAHGPGRVPDEETPASFVYVRLHAGAERPDGCYSETELAAWASRIGTWLRGGFDVYVFFNNDAGGFAVRNAERLRELLSGGDDEHEATAAEDRGDP